MRARTIKATLLGAGALALMAGSAMAADAPVYTKAPPAPVAEPSPIFDVAFGASVSNDYNFRGVSQSNRKWSFGGYLEGQYNSPMGQWYLGTAAWRIEWPKKYGFSDPAAEVNFTGGWRHEWGKASVDIGLIYYYYPSEAFGIDSDFFEVYWKGGYAVSDKTSVGLNLYYTPDLLNLSSFGGGKVRGVYASLTGEHTYWTQGDLSAAVSGEVGHWWIKNTSVFGTKPSYTYWNLGLSWTYKTVTLDLRYHDSSLGNTSCGNFAPVNKWCKAAFIASLKFDSSLSALK